MRNESNPQPEIRSQGRRCFLLLTLLSFCLFGAGVWTVFDFTCDDAGISFSYARSLAEGKGLVLTPGSERVEGYSNLIWVILLSFAIGHGLDPAMAAKVMASMAGLVCLFLTALLPGRIEDRDPEPLDTVPALLLASSTPFIYWTAGGLENSLFTMLLLVAVWAFLGELRRKEAFPLSALCIVLASMTRPEGPLYALVAVPALLLCRPWNIRAGVYWVGAFSIPFGTFLTWRYLYFGDWLPNVYHAKLPDLGLPPLTRASSGLAYLSSYFETWPLYLMVLALLGAAALVRSRTGAWLVGCLIAALSFIVFAGGDWMQHHRFMTPALPFLFLCLGQGLALLVRFYYSPDRVRLGLNGPSVAAVFTVVLVLGRLITPAAFDTANAPGRYRVTFESRVNRGLEFARMARAAGLESASLAEPDAGGTSWASGLTFIDLTGLTDRTLATWGHRAKARDEYLFGHRRPTFLRWHGVWGKATGLEGSPHVARDYIRLPALPGDQPEDRNFVRREVLIAGSNEVPQYPLASSFGGEITLTGLTVLTDHVAPGGCVDLLLYWSRGISPSAGVHEIGVRLSGQERPITLTHDLAIGWFPAMNWKPEERIRERVRMPIPPDATEGDYRLVITARSFAGRLLPVRARRALEATVAVGRESARRRSLDLGEALLATGSDGESRVGVWHQVRQLECSASLTEAELIRYRKAAASRLLDVAKAELIRISRGDGGVHEMEAAACVLQARDWGVKDEQVSGRLLNRLLTRSSELQAEGNTRTALGKLALALKVDGGSVKALRSRDRLWAEFVAQDASAH